MKQRGFFFDREPGFHDLKGGFRDAASEKRAESRDRVLRRVLAKFALLDEQGEPIEAVAKMFGQSNFGYGDEPAKGGLSGDPTFGADMGMPMETGDRNGLSRNLSYGGV
jgi:hypothetical protein